MTFTPVCRRNKRRDRTARRSGTRAEFARKPSRPAKKVNFRRRLRKSHFRSAPCNKHPHLLDTASNGLFKECRECRPGVRAVTPPRSRYPRRRRFDGRTSAGANPRNDLLLLFTAPRNGVLFISKGKNRNAHDVSVVFLRHHISARRARNEDRYCR